MNETFNAGGMFREPSNYNPVSCSAPRGWMPIFHVSQLEQTRGHNSAALCRCNPCLCTPDSHCGCGGAHSTGIAAPINYCNVCGRH